MTPAQVRGLDVFLNKAKCDACHEGVNFTSNMYANLGVGADKPDPDVAVSLSRRMKRMGCVKTPRCAKLPNRAVHA